MSQAQQQEHQGGQVSHHGRQTGYAVEIERREERGERRDSHFCTKVISNRTSIRHHYNEAIA